MNPALSRNGRRTLRGYFGLVVLFLYAPILILLVFSFNNSQLPSFPLSGFTLHWYHQFLVNPEIHGALKTSAKKMRRMRPPFFESAASIRRARPAG